MVEQVRPAVRLRRTPAADKQDGGFPQWTWHLDEVYVKINGEMHYLWRGLCQSKCTASEMTGAG
jgi:transposase-like protein